MYIASKRLYFLTHCYSLMQHSTDHETSVAMLYFLIGIITCQNDTAYLITLINNCVQT